MSRHLMMMYKPFGGEDQPQAWCMNEKHVRCRGVLWYRVGTEWKRPRPSTAAAARDLTDALRAAVAAVIVGLSPWVLVLALGVGIGGALAIERAINVPAGVEIGGHS